MRPQQKGVSPFIEIASAETNSALQRKISCPATFISRICAHTLDLTHHMKPALIRCHGCGTEYTPQGLSQHVSKTRDPRCQYTPVTSRAPAASSSNRLSALPPLLNPDCTQSYSIDGTLEDPNDLVDGTKMPEGAFVIICIARDCI